MKQTNIFAVGDSHSIYYFDSNIVNHHWVGWGGGNAGHDVSIAYKRAAFI